MTKVHVVFHIPITCLQRHFPTKIVYGLFSPSSKQHVWCIMACLFLLPKLYYTICFFSFCTFWLQY